MEQFRERTSQGSTVEQSGSQTSLNRLHAAAKNSALRNDYQTATQYYEKMVRINDQDGKAWTALGHCYLMKADFQKSFHAYQRALNLVDANSDPNLWYGIGLLYHKVQSFDYAESAFKTVLKIFPTFEHMHEIKYKLGLIYIKKGLYKKAINYFQQSQEHIELPAPRQVNLIRYTALAYQKSGESETAIQMYMKALELMPNNYKTLQYLGWAYAEMGDYDAALEALSGALENNSGECSEAGDTHYLLGRVHLLMSNYVESQLCFQRAIYKNPNAYIYWCSIGILYARNKQPFDAFECLIRSSTLSSDKPYVWLNLGALYEHSNQEKEAKLAYQRAIQIDGNFFNLADRIEKIINKQDPGPIPEYEHPPVEISEIPFSLENSLQYKPKPETRNQNQSEQAQIAQDPEPKSPFKSNSKELITPSFENATTEVVANGDQQIQSKIFMKNIAKKPASTPARPARPVQPKLSETHPGLLYGRSFMANSQDPKPQERPIAQFNPFGNTEQPVNNVPLQNQGLGISGFQYPPSLFPFYGGPMMGPQSPRKPDPPNPQPQMPMFNPMMAANAFQQQMQFMPNMMFSNDMYQDRQQENQGFPMGMMYNPMMVSPQQMMMLYQMMAQKQNQRPTQEEEDVSLPAKRANNRDEDPGGKKRRQNIQTVQISTNQFINAICRSDISKVQNHSAKFRLIGRRSITSQRLQPWTTS